MGPDNDRARAVEPGSARAEGKALAEAVVDKVEAGWAQAEAVADKAEAGWAQAEAVVDKAEAGWALVDGVSAPSAGNALPTSPAWAV
jgi:hypothetical protein